MIIRMLAVTPGSFPELFTYAMYVQGVPNTITVDAKFGEQFFNDGQYAAAKIGGTYTGKFLNSTGGTLLPETVNYATANNQLNDLAFILDSYVGILDAWDGETITFSPGVYEPSSNLYIESTDQTLTFDAGGDPSAQFFIIAPTYITMTNPTCVLLNGASASNIFWRTGAITPGPPASDGAFTVTYTVDASIPFPGTVVAYTAIDFTFTGSSVTNGNSGHLFAQIGAITIVSPSFINSNDGPVVCYAEGTNILTKRGYVAVEDLRVGDVAISRGDIENNNSIRNARAGFRPISWVSKFKVHNLTAESAPICIKTGALGENQPFEDLYVSPMHAIVVNGTMVRAHELVNGTSIVQKYDMKSVVYYHVELASHSVIVANGVMAESYLDVGNRYVFQKSEKLRLGA